VAGGAAIVGVGYGLATAPATTAVIVGSGVVSQKTFEAMGLSPRAAAVYSAIVTAPVAAASATSSSISRRRNHCTHETG
jgi:cytochrome c biogenesis protein CcdA